MPTVVGRYGQQNGSRCPIRVTTELESSTRYARTDALAMRADAAQARAAGAVGARRILHTDLRLVRFWS
jgi:hypothetical protein